MSAAGAGIVAILGILVGAVIGIVVFFIPTVIAFIRGNCNKSQILKYQIAVIVLSIIVGIVSFLVGLLVGFLSALISAVWGLVSLVAWIYFLICAVKDSDITILDRFGIHF